MKIIGYSIGGLFAIILLAPIVLAVWNTYELVSVLTSTVVEPAVISFCSYQSGRNRSSTGFRKGSGRGPTWVPIAVTQLGIKVEGKLGWGVTKQWCEKSMGHHVAVLIHPTDPTKNRIYTFFQFWFTPLILIVVSLLLYPQLYRMKRLIK